jgi:hypothetical protein
MPISHLWLAALGAILVVGAIPGCFAAIGLWADWELREAPIIAARVLDTFSPPCEAEQVELRCESHFRAPPKGPYKFVVVNTAPFQGVYVVARYAEGTEIFLDVVPMMLRTPRVHISESIGKPLDQVANGS